MAGNIWCRYLCPTGRGLKIFLKTGLFEFRKSKEYNHCEICRLTCEMVTEPERYNCTTCGDCRSVCLSERCYIFRLAKKDR